MRLENSAVLVCSFDLTDLHETALDGLTIAQQRYLVIAQIKSLIEWSEQLEPRTLAPKHQQPRSGTNEGPQ